MDLADFELVETGDEPVKVYDLPESEEAQAFEAGFRFYEGSQHDHHRMRWDGTTCGAGDSYLRDRYIVHGLVPIDVGLPGSRRPDLPTPTAATIVHRNTGLMFGSPLEIDMIVDEHSQEFLREVYRFGDLHLALSEGRNFAGGGGNAIEVPCIVGGRPILQTYRPSEFKVLQWSEREVWQPARIVRQVLVPMLSRDRSGNLRKDQFWVTTEWTDREVIEYRPVPKGWDKEIPEKGRKLHGATRCPVTWYKNTPSDTPWGLTDFHGLEPRCDKIDTLGSHLQSAIGQNCDATVYHLDEEGTRRRNKIVKRGRGQVWQGSEKGEFGLVETSARGLEVADRFWRGLQADTFELADVVRVTAETAGSLKAAEAIRLLWRASEVRVSMLWPQRANTARRILESFYEMGKANGVSSIEAPRKGTIILPSRVLPAEPKPPPAPPKPPEEGEAPELPQAPEAKPAEKPAPKLAPHQVGKFGFIALKLGPYFQSTASEKQAEVGALGTATGGGKLLSDETARTLAARTFGVDPHEERVRIAEEEAEADARAVDAFNRQSAAGLEDADEEAEEDSEDEETRAKVEPGKPEDDEEEDDEEEDKDE